MNCKKATLVIGLAICLTACGKNNNGDNITSEDTISTPSDAVSTTELKTESTTEDSYVIPDEAKMATDIDDFGGNVIVFSDGDNYTLETQSVVIDKASQEEKKFVVYCTAAQDSDLFTGNNSYVLTYNYYEIGGWILDECTISTIDMTPKKILDKEQVENHLTYMGYTSYEYVSEEKINDNSYKYYYNTRVEYPYMDEVSVIEISCEYGNDLGWELYSYTTSTYEDWSKMYGTYYTSYENAGVNQSFTLTIKNIDSTLNTITVDIIATDDSSNGFESLISTNEPVNTVSLTDVVMSYELEQYSLHIEEGIEYESDIEFYYNSDIDYTHEMTLYWGKYYGVVKMHYDCCDATMTKIE